MTSQRDIWQFSIAELGLGVDGVALDARELRIIATFDAIEGQHPFSSSGEVDQGWTAGKPIDSGDTVRLAELSGARA